ncbi:MAG: hypothetical protein AAF789_13100, partial [Bacteroidota bacterium]
KILEIEEDTTALKVLKRSYIRSERYVDLLKAYTKYTRDNSFSHKMMKAKLVRLAVKKDQLPRIRLKNNIGHLEHLLTNSDDLSAVQTFFLDDNYIKAKAELNQIEGLKKHIRDRIKVLTDSEWITNRLIQLYSILFVFTLLKENNRKRAINILEKLIGDREVQDEETFINRFISKLSDPQPKNSIPARKKLAKLYKREGQRGKALAQCNEIVSIAPNDLFAKQFKERL